MKRIIALAIFIVGISLGMPNRTSAQTSSVYVAVPFDFAVGDRILPRGTYRIEPDGDFLLFNSKEHASASVFANVSHGETSIDGRDVLSFDVVDGKHFLRKIASSSATTSAQFPESRLEKKAEEVHVARLNTALDRGR